MAVGLSAATSWAKVGPDKTVIRGLNWGEMTSSMISDGRSRVLSSSPLVALTKSISGLSHGSICSYRERTRWEGTTLKTNSTPDKTSCKLLDINVFSETEKPGR